MLDRMCRGFIANIGTRVCQFLEHWERRAIGFCTSPRRSLDRSIFGWSLCEVAADEGNTYAQGVLSQPSIISARQGVAKEAAARLISNGTLIGIAPQNFYCIRPQFVMEMD